MSIGFLVLLVVVGTTIWVGVDASRREWGEGKTGTAGWVVGCVLLWIVCFPIYLAKRRDAPLKENASSPVRPAGFVALERSFRECPHCKEDMRRDASVCPHCREPSSPWRFHEGRWWWRASAEEPWWWLDERSEEWVQLEAAIPPVE